MWSRCKVGWAKFDSKPGGHWQMPVTKKPLFLALINLHVNGESSRIEVNHDLLFWEAESISGRTYDVRDVVVYRLFQINFRWVYLLDVALNFLQSMYTFLETKVPPPLLNTHRSTLANDQVNRKFWELLAEQVGFNLHLDRWEASLALKQGLKEAKKLLFIFFCSMRIVIKNRKQQGNNQRDAWAFEVGQVLVVVVEQLLVAS